MFVHIQTQTSLRSNFSPRQCRASRDARRGHRTPCRKNCLRDLVNEKRLLFVCLVLEGGGKVTLQYKSSGTTKRFCYYLYRAVAWTPAVPNRQVSACSTIVSFLVLLVTIPSRSILIVIQETNIEAIRQEAAAALCKAMEAPLKCCSPAAARVPECEYRNYSCPVS